MQVINTLKPEFFSENIRHSLKRRKELAALKQNKFIEITQDLYHLVANAVNLSKNQRGRALHLLNVGAKKRKRPEKQTKTTVLAYKLSDIACANEDYSISPPRNAKRIKPNNYNSG